MKMNASKKKKLILLLTSFTTMLSVTLVALFSTRDPNTSSLIASNEYTLTLSSSNGGGSFPSSYGSGVNNNVHTTKGNTVSFTYSNVKSTSGKFCTVASGGYLYNSTEITGLESVNASFSGGSLSLYSSKSTTFSGDATSLSSGSTISISPNFNYFKLVASGETAINSITILYTCATRPEISEVTDIITASDLAATSTSYVSFSGVKKSSDAIYAGQSALNNNANIQFKSKNSDTGLVSTQSGGTVKSVKITIASGSNTVEVYGSDSAYTSDTDLFITASQGTKVGGVSSTGTINFTGSYANFAYVGIRSENGAVYISNIEITWTTSGGSSGGGGDTPTPDPDPEAVSLTASFPYQNTYPTSIDVLRSDDSVFDTLSTSISNVQEYDDTYGEYVIAKNEYILITNTNPNVTITSIDVKVYKYLNFAVYADDSSTAKYEGDGSQGSGDPVVISVEVNASNSVKIVGNGGGSSTSYTAKIYGVDLYLSGIEGDVDVTSVALNKTSTTIAQEQSEQLSATVAPSYATNKNVAWSSSDENIATVSETGLVTGVGVGTATITVTTEDGGFTATCSVTVTAVYLVTSVSLNTTALALHPGDQSSLTATVSPSNATNKNVTWSTSNSSVATVSGGSVTAVAAGTATITVTTVDGSKTATCTVTVTNVAVTGVTLNKSSLTLTRLDTETLTATVAPTNATNKNINWSSSNTSIATVNGGTVTAVAAGTATITATSAADSTKKATCTVTVNPINVTGVIISKTELSLGVGISETITASVSPTNADNPNINWSTSDSSIATVSGGTITGVAEGTATITATSAADSTKKATCTVTVTAVTDVTIDLTAQGFSNQQDVSTVTQSPFSLIFAQGSGSNAPKYYDSGTSVRTYANNTLTVETSGTDKITQIVFTVGGTTSAEVTPDSGTYNSSSKTWTGSATSIVFANGTTGQYHYKAVTITVTPSAPVAATGVKLPSAKEISSIGTSTLPLTYEPSNANTGLAVNWYLSNTSVATINQSSGEITPKSTGTTDVTVELASDTSKTATCTVTVVEQAKDEWTILVYMSGNNLESEDGSATEDLEEIASISGQPSDVNVVVQAGGANSWKSKYSSVIKASTRNRIHLKNKTYVRDDSTTQAKENMGDEATLKSFIKWGIETYPADKIGLIFWNHGGAMGGCCGDEQFSDDYLMNDEIVRAIRAAKSETGYTDKFEFIGYDCCLMQVQDIAGTNSEFANYMVASEASEWGYGWSYDLWIDKLFAKQSTTNILDAIVDGFGETTTETYAYWDEHETEDYPNNQTLSYMNLSYWNAYQTAWDDMISTININGSSAWNTFKSVVSSSFKFENGDYDTYDVGSFISKMKSSTYSSAVKNKVTTLETAYSNLVAKSFHGNYYTDAQVTGLCLFCPIKRSISKSDYSTTATPFGAYRDACIAYGTWAS